MNNPEVDLGPGTLRWRKPKGTEKSCCKWHRANYWCKWSCHLVVSLLCIIHAVCKAACAAVPWWPSYCLWSCRHGPELVWSDQWCSAAGSDSSLRCRTPWKQHTYTHTNMNMDITHTHTEQNMSQMPLSTFLLYTVYTLTGSWIPKMY